jgi:DNA-binding beta-propeller fold protein YncE
VRSRAALLAVVVTMATLACAKSSQQAAAPAACNAPVTGGTITVETPGSPFQALPSADGCWIFVSVANQPNGPTGVALYRRAGGTVSLARMLPFDAGATGMALSHDGHRLIIAGNRRITFVDVDALINGRRAVLGYLDDPAAAGRVYANITADDRYVLIADENSRTISVIDFARAKASGYRNSATIGKIPTGTLPIALTISNDGKYMYATSQWAPESFRWPIECRREGAQADSTPVNPQGAIHIVDMTRAAIDPAHSIVGSVPAGCSAVRLVLSPAGDRAYVTARNSNALLVFDVPKLHTDPLHALIARVPMGTAPVGVAVTADGRRVIVTNSNRFGGSANDHQSLTVIDAARVTEGAGAIVGSIPAGAFPRELRVTSDGRTLVLTNFGSKTIQLIDLTTIR